MREIKIEEETAELSLLIDAKIDVISDIIEVIATEKMEFWRIFRNKHKDLNFKGAYINFTTKMLVLPEEKEME